MHNLYTNSLTNAQLSAVTHNKGACLVLAGPGSGKTKVITHRVAYLIAEHHIPAEYILTITFTKSAAKEMEARFLCLMPNTHPWFGTFHSCFYNILKHSYSNFPNQFITQKLKKSILQKITREVFQNQNYNESTDIESALGLYINSMLNFDCLQKYADVSAEAIKKIYAKYRTVLKNENLLDFDVLLMQMYELLRDNLEIRQKWQNQFPYVLIDECQDMNFLQYEIIKLLTGPENNLFLVGDDDQAIYRFRGSNITVMNRFIEDFEPVKQIVLDMNFRSTKSIVDAAGKVIIQNQNRFDKKIQTYCADNTGVHIKSFVHKKDMYSYVADSLLNAPKHILNDVAIICRTNLELKSWGHILRQNNIPYVSKEENNSIFSQDWYMEVEHYIKLHLSGKEILPIKNMRPYLAIKFIWNKFVYHKYSKRSIITEHYQDFLEQFQQILDEAKNVHSLKEWLAFAQKDIERFELELNQRNSTEDFGIRLITMHASKGLEFHKVFIPDVNKGKIPRGDIFTKEELEEERRLFYVAMTRPKRELEILYIKGTEDHKLQPSVFIEPLL